MPAGAGGATEEEGAGANPVCTPTVEAEGLPACVSKRRGLQGQAWPSPAKELAEEP